MNRRKFLLSTGIGGLTAISSRLSFSIEPDGSKSENSAIYIFLSGGPSHIELFNTIPNSTPDRTSVVGTSKTNVIGMNIGGLFTNISQKANKFVVVNNFHHKDANHESAVHWMMTGEQNFPNASQKWPSYGSMISGVLGTNTKKDSLPTYVKLSPINADGPAWMGAKYLGYTAAGEGLKDLMLQNQERLYQRLRMIDAIESSSRINKKEYMSKSWTDLREQAVNVLLGKASEAFAIEKDDDYKTFSKDNLSKDMLTAIRLVERGVKFVTINYGGWDMHNKIADGFNSRLPPLDNVLSLYFDVAEKRQLNHRNMLVMSGDFGRTPKINKDGGRDHWPHLVPLFIACDGYEMGRVIGRSDANAERPDGLGYEPEDLKWTILNHVGVSKHQDWVSSEGRPMHFVKETAKNILVEG